MISFTFYKCNWITFNRLVGQWGRLEEQARL